MTESTHVRTNGGQAWWSWLTEQWSGAAGRRRGGGGGGGAVRRGGEGELLKPR